MTIAEKIKSRVDELGAPQQAALLSFLESLESAESPKPPRRQNPAKARSRRAEVSAAVRGIAGIWKDRTDLPKDPVEAVKVIRARMFSRGRNG